MTTGEKNKYFGTDGFRGEAGVSLTADHAYKIGRFLGWYYASPLSGFHEANYKPRIAIGKDTRRSGYMLEYAIAAGITASGADAYMLHVTTTPSVSYVVRTEEFDCGIMITASHNPYYDNGIKLINRYGEKADDDILLLVEAYLDGDMKKLGIEEKALPFAVKSGIGSAVDYVAGRNRYVGYLISLASHSYREMRVGLDCANGASWMIAKAVFDALGAKTYIIGASPDGLNINNSCGSTHADVLGDFVLKNRLDVGFSFDGDADRCMAVDEKGNVTDGDMILYILAKRLRRFGTLDKNTVAATVMSNTGLLRALSDEGISFDLTGVGDRYVYECMQKNGYMLGGEQSGHIIIRKYATTGDGLLTAIMLCEEMRDRKMRLSELSAPVRLYPQITQSIRVSDKAAALSDAEVKAEAEAIKKEIGENGRLLLRASGTEPVIRIMLECKTEKLCREYIKRLVDILVKRGYSFE